MENKYEGLRKPTQSEHTQIESVFNNTMCVVFATGLEIGIFEDIFKPCQDIVLGIYIGSVKIDGVIQRVLVNFRKLTLSGGKDIVFCTATSSVVDYNMITSWIKNNTPVTYGSQGIYPVYDATQFIDMLHEAHGIYV